MGRMSADIEATYQAVERLANLFELSYEPMLAWRLDRPVEVWNAAAARLYRYSLDEAFGRSSNTLLQTRFPIDFTELRLRLRNHGHWSGEVRRV